MNNGFVIVLCTLALSGCAFLHHVQIGEIDNRKQFQKTKIDIKVSEMGLSLEEVGAIASSLAGSKGGRKNVSTATNWIGFFQYGPKTGNPVFVENYARNIGDQLWQACPSGKITGLNSIRESNRYPVISGEIVRITGYCLSSR